MGVVTVELFVDGAERLIVNKIGLGPQELGCASLVGAVTSQFHNHLRAVLDWPLGETRLHASVVAMTIVSGGSNSPGARPSFSEELAVPGTVVHRDAEDGTGRNLGHVIACGSDMDEARKAANRGAARLRGEP